jgi:opacity protein-like surface antigen
MAAEAQQGPMTFGPRVVYNFDAEEFGIGAHLTKPLTDAISLYPSFEYLFVSNSTWLTFNADLIYKVPGENLQWLYVGGGLGITRFSFEGCSEVPGLSFDCSTTDVGLNLIGGFQPAGSGRIKPFAEARFTLGGSESFQVAAGLKIPLGN